MLQRPWINPEQGIVRFRPPSSPPILGLPVYCESVAMAARIVNTSVDADGRWINIEIGTMLIVMGNEENGVGGPLLKRKPGRAPDWQSAL